MSLVRDGVLKAGVWATVIWTQDVWFETSSAPIPVTTSDTSYWDVTVGIQQKRKKRKDYKLLLLGW